MANKIYPKYKEALLGGLADISLTAGNVKVILVDLADYTYSDAHSFLTSVGAPARVATSANVAGYTVADGTFDCDDITWSSVTGDVSEAIIYYVDTGTEGTSRLVYFNDTNVTNLPVTPNGGDITINHNVSGIFTI